MVKHYPSLLEQGIDSYWRRNRNSTSRISQLRLLLTHTIRVTKLVEDRLSRDTYSQAPLYLSSSMQHACTSMGLTDHVPILTVASADSFDSFVYDVEDIVFGSSKSRIRRFFRTHCTDISTRFDKHKYIVVGAPRMEGQDLLWTPVVLGHELGHRIISKDIIEELNAIIWLRDPGIHPTLNRMAENWITEVMCDAYTIRTFGVSGMAAMSESLEAYGHTDRVGHTHPPARLRIQLMQKWLRSDLNQQQRGLEEYQPILRPWTGFRNVNHIASTKPHKVYPRGTLPLIAKFVSNASEFWNRVKDLPGWHYDSVSRADIVRDIARDFELGMPGSLENIDTVSVPTATDEMLFHADVVTAAWLARARGYSPPCVDLAKKTLENRDFVRRWRAVSKDSAFAHSNLSSEDPRDIDEDSCDPGVLSPKQIKHRLQLIGSDPKTTQGKHLVVRPCDLAGIKDASLDIRLGNQFIVFVRSTVASFAPLQSKYDPRSIQRRVRLSWGDKFILHPNELVLASTLEYFVLPSDISAQVITRSSYGRLGLLSATAVQVQPNFHGCLTLELVNLGTVPLELIPGERIAQLVFSKTGSTPLNEDDASYLYTIGPQFSRVGSDPEAKILTKL